MESLREEAKLKWKKYLTMFINQPEFKEFLNSQINKISTITTIQPHHMNEILSILCYNFSCMGGTNNHRILMTTPEDSVERFKCEIQHTLKTGMNWVALDKYNHVIIVYYGFDYCDPPNYGSEGVSDGVKKVKEMHKFALDNCKYIQAKFNNDLKNNIKYGDVFYHAIIAKRFNFKGGTGLVKGVFPRSINGMMGYKLSYGDATNPLTIKNAHKESVLPFVFAKEYNFKDFIFSDGVLMIDKIKQLKSKYCFSDKYVELMKQNCKQTIVWVDFDKIRAVHSNSMGGSQSIVFWTNIWKQIVSVSKINLKSKL